MVLCYKLFHIFAPTNNNLKHINNIKKNKQKNIK